MMATGMVKKLALSDFRAVRRVLGDTDFALSEGDDLPPSDPINPVTWHGIVDLPDDVAIRISNHNGTRLELLHSLWGNLIESIDCFDPADEMFGSLWDATTCIQCSNFNLLHGFYRGAIAELRTALELVMIGTFGSLNSTDADYRAWKAGKSQLGFTRCRSSLSKSLASVSCGSMLDAGQLLATLYAQLCNYTHSRPDSSDGDLWQSNGPIYVEDAVSLTFEFTLTVCAACYLLLRLANSNFAIPEDSEILFELDGMSEYHRLVRAYTDLFGRPPSSGVKGHEVVDV